MSQDRSGQHSYCYPQPGPVDWRFVVNSGQIIDLTAPVPSRQQWQPHGYLRGASNHTVVAPQMMQVCLAFFYIPVARCVCVRVCVRVGRCRCSLITCFWPCYIQSPLNYGLPQQHSPTIDLDVDVKQSEDSSQEEDATKNVQDEECSSPTTSQASGFTSNLEYCVKVVPVDRKGGYQVHKLRQCK